MTLETLAGFAAASAILLAIPGPTILLVVSYALGGGMRVALPAATGVALGDLTAMTLSMLGLGALLAASATLFTALKWLGAAYLIWLGVRLWRAGGRLDAPPVRAAVSPVRAAVPPVRAAVSPGRAAVPPVRAAVSPGRAAVPPARMAAHAWLVTALNPKSLTFFIAFLPQFLDPRGDLLTQMAAFETIFVVLAFLNALGYALLAARARGLFAAPARVRLFHRVGGGLLIGAGLAAARATP
ncbi:Lysine exporter protein (LYSE/YGGA) [Methylobacterium sp. 4-46]|uniref:LysE family translocator n=1 Tax=unclassified Methylobacterium TaxID=2615210 RepID=UPI000165CD22|nr:MULTISPECIES: LysE family translocator [Methylobacterium]ACA19750.1 Lysine exporter protein (LYSE/YGGA) [Methylobacterium sp. 4-46]WFT78940.1 LysE family translocator [Methylobacterium nodulans]